MKVSITFLTILFAALALRADSPLPEPADSPESCLRWDAASKESIPKPGETSAAFTFSATNRTQVPIVINAIRTSCGCTLAQLPSVPFSLGAGSNVTLAVRLDLRGRQGTIIKSVQVDSTAGIQTLLIRSTAPADQKAAVHP